MLEIITLALPEVKIFNAIIFYFFIYIYIYIFLYLYFFIFFYFRIVYVSQKAYISL